MSQIPWISAAEIAERLDTGRAADLLEEALHAGVDPDADPARSSLSLAGRAGPDGGARELLMMPSAATPHPAVKLATIGGDPRIQGVCVVFDGATLAPAALLDGAALTLLRTAAVSALAVRHLASPDASRLLIFGRGAQAKAHAAAIRAERPITEVDFAGREAEPREIAELVGAADVICCCTTAREPLFAGADVGDGTTVVAIGSHEPDARETDVALARRATVVVESTVTALREAGDVVQAVAAGALDPAELVTLVQLVRGEAWPDPARPRLFKSTGMAWEDAVLAATLADLAP